MTQTQQVTETLELLSCTECGTAYGLTASFRQRRRDDHKTFHCPNGHAQYYPGENELEKTKRMLDNENKRREWAEQDAKRAKERAESAKRSAASYKGKLNHVKAHVGAGLCPCCRRNFENLRRHMNTKHPGYGEE